MNKLDELFKEKLTEYSITPSNAAWEKIESDLSKKNNAVLWLRWAAVFVLGAFVLGTILVNREENTLPLAEKVESPANATEDIHNVAPVVAEHNLASDNYVTKKKNKIKKSSQTPATYSIIQKEEEEEKEKNIVNATSSEETTSTLVETTVANVTTSNEKLKETTKSIVLVYTLDAIEPTVETPPAEVVSNDKKDSSLKRVINFAKDVKNGDTPFGGIREMKDDLFALELKKKTTSKKQ
ncbi:hypothetical protein BH09BAC3_BH09BAC3_20170 [soil metagenome]